MDTVCRRLAVDAISSNRHIILLVSCCLSPFVCRRCRLTSHTPKQRLRHRSCLPLSHQPPALSHIASPPSSRELCDTQLADTADTAAGGQYQPAQLQRAARQKLARHPCSFQAPTVGVDDDDDDDMGMGAVAATTREDEEQAKKMEAGDDTVGQKLDAGALFVLQSKGSWLHCGYHLTTSIVAPALLSLPFAFAALGWAAGVIYLVIGAAVTFYSYNLISLVLEHHARQGRRQLRFRDMATDILGPGWGKYCIGPIQFSVCFGAVIGCTLLAGQSMKAIYLLANPGGTIKLYVFVAIFGVFMTILAQLPSFHSLRHVNLISLMLCLAYSFCAVAGSIYLGNSDKAPPKDYSISGDTQNRVFGVFNAIAIIATTYGNGIIPEIQATVAAPVTGKMFRGLCLCYAVVVTTFFSVAISGYWAVGNQAQGTLLSNFMVDGAAVIPKALLLVTQLFTLLQLSAVGVVYLQPTNEVLEGLFSDASKGQYAPRNVLPRLASRTVAVALATTVAAMLPFFGDLNSLIGAFGFLPLDFAVPALFYNVTFKPSKKGVVFWLNTTIAVVFSGLAVIASVAAVRQIVLDAKTYKLFANV